MTEHSHSETSSDEAFWQELEELKFKNNWLEALVSIYLQEQGGAVELKKSDLERIPKAKEIIVRDQGDTFIVEGEFYELAE